MQKVRNLQETLAEKQEKNYWLVRSMTLMTDDELHLAYDEVCEKPETYKSIKEVQND